MGKTGNGLDLAKPCGRAAIKKKIPAMTQIMKVPIYCLMFQIVSFAMHPQRETNASSPLQD